MPDQDGKLTPEDRENVRRWLGSYWAGSWVCPVSRHTDWQLADHLVRLPAWSPAGPGSESPSVLLTCTACGYRMTFDAVLMGIVAPETERQEPEPITPRS